MGFLKGFLILILIVFIGFLIWAILPSGFLFGEQKYNVEVKATVSHGIVSLPQSFDLSNVQSRVTGVSKNVEWNTIYSGVGTYDAHFKFCIEESCQYETVELSQFTFGESKTAVETISGISKGTHTLTVEFITDNTVRDSYVGSVTV